MNKEVVIAIFIGIALGIAGAVYINRESLRSNSKGSLLAVDTVEISAFPSPNVQQVAKIQGLPTSLSVYTKQTLTLNILPQESASQRGEETIFVFHTLPETAALPQNKRFTQTIPLKPGFNEVVVGQLGAKHQNTTTSRFFYLPQEKSASPAVAGSTDKEATSEADVIKQKLEQKVFELRYNAKKALYGTVLAIKPAEVELDVDGAKKKAKLEPEVTRFYETTTDGEVSDIDISDIAVGDAITVFISTLADEEKSYTVYKEPDVRLVVGKIAQVLSTNYQISVVGLNKATSRYDVESTTLQEVYDSKTKKIAKSGFSQLSVGAHLFVLAGGAQTGSSMIRYLAIP